jgi:hypothetical protein
MIRSKAPFVLVILVGCAVPDRELEPAVAPDTASALPVLSARDLEAVSADRLVVKHSVLFRGGRKYVGGVSFQTVRAPPELVLDTIFSTQAALEWMPQTLSARAVGGSGDDLTVRFEQGEEPFVATHTLHIWRDDLAIRWQLDPRHPHDIADVWGFLSATPFDAERSLLTLGILLDLGDGVVRAFAEPDIQRTVLGTPETIKTYVEARAAQ